MPVSMKTTNAVGRRSACCHSRRSAWCRRCRRRSSCGHGRVRPVRGCRSSMRAACPARRSWPPHRGRQPSSMPSRRPRCPSPRMARPRFHSLPGKCAPCCSRASIKSQPCRPCTTPTWGRRWAICWPTSGSAGQRSKCRRRWPCSTTPRSTCPCSTASCPAGNSWRRAAARSGSCPANRRRAATAWRLRRTTASRRSGAIRSQPRIRGGSASRCGCGPLVPTCSPRCVSPSRACRTIASFTGSRPWAEGRARCRCRRHGHSSCCRSTICPRAGSAPCGCGLTCSGRVRSRSTKCGCSIWRSTSRSGCDSRRFSRRRKNDPRPVTWAAALRSSTARGHGFCGRT